MKNKIYFNQAMAQELCDRTSGSGLDSKPYITERKKSIQVWWDYHLMDEQGYYNGWWSFKVIIPKSDPMQYTIQGRRGNPRTASAEDTKDYLYQVFEPTISEILRSNGITPTLVNEKIYPGDPEYNPAIPFAKEHGYHFGRAHYEYTGEEV